LQESGWFLRQVNLALFDPTLLFDVTKNIHNLAVGIDDELLIILELYNNERHLWQQQQQQQQKEKNNRNPKIEEAGFFNLLL
jgi:hypothetical protein